MAEHLTTVPPTRADPGTRRRVPRPGRRRLGPVAVSCALLVTLAWLDWTLNGGSPFGVPYPWLLTALLLGNVVVTRWFPGAKRRLVARLQRWVLNPLARVAVRTGLPLGFTLLETTGRRSGRPRVVPVGDGPDGDRFWIVAEHGDRSGYVRNLRADPRVRVLVRDGLRLRWRTGTAAVLPDDDPYRRQRTIVGWRHPMRALNALVVRILAVDPVTVRIDLDPV